jgi:HEAT repeat protein
MSHSAAFADHFARLTSLLVRQADDVDEQKQQLLAAVASAKDLPVLLTRESEALLADGSPITKGTIFTMVLVDRLKRHDVVRLEVTPGPSAADVLGLARILAAPPAEGGASFLQRLAALRASSLRIETAPLPPKVTPTHTPRVSLETIEIVSEDQMRSSIARPASRTPAGTMTSPPPMFAEFSGPKAGVTVDQLLKALDDATDIGAIENVLTALPPHIAASLEQGRTEQAVAAVHGIARREARTEDGQAKKMIGQALRRMLTPTLTTAVMKQLPGAGDRLADFVVLLSHGGDLAVETLADRLAESEQAKERRAIFSVLVQLKSGVPLFIHMLGDRRWFVVRNAADLLAQMNAPEAEEPLIRALGNADVRARRSVVAALARYQSPKAQGSLRRALLDPAPEVRLAAAGGIGRSKSPEMTTALIEALGREEDADVRRALLGALGRQANEEAVRKLVEAAGPQSLFRRKSSEFRVAAVRGLREAGTPAALQALKSFADDKDETVREAVKKKS